MARPGNKGDEEMEWWRDSFENIVCSLEEERRKNIRKECTLLTRKNSPLLKEGACSLKKVGSQG